MKKLRIGIIGAGMIARMHSDEWQRQPDVNIVAIADVNPAMLAETSARFKIGQTYEDYQQLLARDDLDAVDICVHDQLRARISCDALKQGKHVYCERPVGESFADVRLMAETARETGQLLHIKLSSLYTPETRAARMLIHDGQLGDIYHVRSTGYRRRDLASAGECDPHEIIGRPASGGALQESAINNVAQMLLLLNLPEVTRISGHNWPKTETGASENQAGNRAGSRAGNMDIEEMAAGYVRFSGGQSMDIIESRAVYLDAFAGSCLFGSRGGIRLLPFTYYSTLTDLVNNTGFNLNKDDWRSLKLKPEDALSRSSLAHWAAALRGQVQLLPTAEIALQTALISEGIYLSRKLDREVTADEVANYLKEDRP